MLTLLKRLRAFFSSFVDEEARDPKKGPRSFEETMRNHSHTHK